MHIAAVDTKTNVCRKSPVSLEAQFKYELRLLRVLETKNQIYGVVLYLIDSQYNITKNEKHKNQT